MNTSENLHQLGLPIERLSSVLLNWTCFEPRRQMLISLRGSTDKHLTKTEGWAIVETRDSQLAAAILRDVPEARLRELEKPVVTIAL